MKAIKKNVLFAVITAVLVSIIFLCFSRSVYSQDKKGIRALDRESLEALENEYLEQAAGLMKEYGCEYSGITMTKMFERDGCISYEVLIHHRNLSYLSTEELEELKGRLTGFSEAFQDAEFTYSFSYLS